MRPCRSKSSPAPRPSRCAKLWLLAGLLLLARTAAAELLPVRAYSIQDGLAGDSVTDILQDSRGYLWFATTDGVSRFDGERFTSYGRQDGLPHARVHDVLEDHDGNVWVATHRGLARFVADRPAGRPAFERVLLSPQGREPVFSIHEDRAGRLWAGGDGHLYVLEAAQGSRKAREVGLGPLPSPAGPVLAFAETPDGSLWVGTRQGLLRRPPQGRAIAYPVMPHFGGDTVRSLAVDRAGRLWVVHTLDVFVLVPEPAGRSGGGARPSLDQDARARGCAVNLTSAPPLPRAPGEVCKVEAQDGPGWQRVQISAGGEVRLVSSRGLYLWDGHLRVRTEENGLTDRALTSIAEDREGDLWLGTEGRGAMRVAPHGFLGFTTRDGLAHPQVLSIYEGRDGALYVHSGSTFEDALWLQRFDGSRFTAVRPRRPPEIAYLGRGSHQSILLDRSSRWWIATGQGLLRYPAGARFEDLAAALPVVYTVRDGLGGDSVERILEDSRGDVWIGTNGPRSLSLWSPDSRKIRSFGREDGLPPGTPSALAEDESGQLWIGFSQGGMVRLRGGRFERFGPEQGLPEGPVSDLHMDRSGRLWVATEEDGLGRLDRPDAARPRFVRYTTAQGLSSDQVFCLADDVWGRIYLGGDKGVDRLDPRTGHVEPFTTADGLASSLVEVAGQDHHGYLWFGTRHGISRLAPLKEPPPPMPVPWITGVRIDGLPQRVSELGASRVTGLEMGSGRSRVEIDFLALTSRPRERVSYQYRMEGLDRSWSSVSPSRSVVYAHLPPGRFRFLVRAVIPTDRLASPVMAEALLVVHPQVWWQIGLLALAAFLLGGSLYALYRYRATHLVSMERMRTRIATDLHDDLGSSLSRISILSEVARRRAEGDPEEVRLLTDIGEAAREMMEALGESIWAIDPRRDNLRSLVTRIRRFAGDLLESRGIAWSMQSPPDPEQVKLSPEERRHLYLIFKEAIHNAARHSGASSVSLSMALAGRRLSAVMRDDGKGFVAPQATESVGRHGLPSMVSRAAQLGGSLHIDSVPGRGTEIRLEVPLSGGSA